MFISIILQSSSDDGLNRNINKLMDLEDFLSSIQDSYESYEIDNMSYDDGLYIIRRC